MQEEPTAGFIAQELDEVQTSVDAEWLNLVLKDNPEKWEATYGNLLPVMVKAIQELSIKNEKLEKENDELRTESKMEVAQLKKENEEFRTESRMEVVQLKKENEELRLEKDRQISELNTRLSKYEEVQTMLVKELQQIKSSQQEYKIKNAFTENSN
ncbi:MAG: hypothetical protein BWY38_03250 [Ignavibacteria bacterium ADurb.Bin266]|nr:MAG: hypothetical protein BWY38_03250 [Ignavibacteria bacterium ADurb.Bin266]